MKAVAIRTDLRNDDRRRLAYLSAAGAATLWVLLVTALT